jgi:hypothetical protein
MHLPVRLAVSVPIGVAAVAGTLFGIVNVTGTKLPAWIKLYQISGISLLFGVVALLFVVPNAIAAIVANRLSERSLTSLGAFALALAVAVAAVWFAQAAVLDRTLNGVGGFPTKMTDWKAWSLIALDVGICIVTAVWAGRGANV